MSHTDSNSSYPTRTGVSEYTGRLLIAHIAMTLTIAELKARSVEFTNLLGNDHDTTSAEIVGLLDEEFSVQHGEMPPSTGGRDAFLTKLRGRLEIAQGKVSVEVKHVIAEVYEDGKEGGRCWIYSRKNTPLGCSNSVSNSFVDTNGKMRQY